MLRASKSVNWRAESVIGVALTLCWSVTLGIMDYSGEDWVGIVVVFYLAYVATRIVLSSVVSFGFRGFVSYSSPIVERIDAELRRSDSERQPMSEIWSDMKRNPVVRFAVTLFVLAWLSAIIGLSLLLMIPVMEVAGFVPLGAVFVLTALVAFGFGTVVIAALMGLSFMLYFWLDNFALPSGRGSVRLRTHVLRPLTSRAWASLVFVRFPEA